MNFIKSVFLVVMITMSCEATAQSSCDVFSSYYGGNQFDEIKSVCVDANKNSYVIGNTYSTDLPITIGLINDTALGNYDVFVAKFDSCGALLWSTYFGGTGYDSAEKMTLKNDGTILFCGYTTSTNSITTGGSFQTNNNGGYDCFITNISTNGIIVWSTYFGKSGGDFAFDIKVDALDNIVIGGTSTSTNLYTTPLSFQPTHKGNTDAFIARFNKTGVLKWCTYYGGAGSEDIHALTIDANSNIIGVGESFSSNLNTSVGAFQNSNDGVSDSYIIKLDSSGARVFSSYIGGSGLDDAWGLTCDALNNIYFAGHTNSVDFDTTPLSYQTTNNGGVDCYLTKWSPTGTLLKSTLFGGPLTDNSIRLICVNQTQLLLLAETENTNLPTYATSQQTISGGNYDLYLALFDNSSLYPTWATYYGGNTDEDGHDVALTNPSIIVFCGSSNSTNYPISAAAHQSSLNNSVDGVITKLVIPQSSLTNLNDNNSISTYKIYPNPFSDYILINYETLFFVEIKNALGQVVYASKNTHYIHTKNYCAGIYYITINNNTQKFVKY